MGTTDAALYNKAGGMSSFANILEPSVFSVVISNNVLMSNIDTRITMYEIRITNYDAVANTSLTLAQQLIDDTLLVHN